MKQSSRIAALAVAGVLVVGGASTAFAQSTASGDGAVFTGFYPQEGAPVHSLSIDIDSSYLEQLVQPHIQSSGRTAATSPLLGDAICTYQPDDPWRDGSCHRLCRLRPTI